MSSKSFCKSQLSRSRIDAAAFRFYDVGRLSLNQLLLAGPR
jgi:hypothetical protein